MHGGGTVVGSQVVAAMALKTCCARDCETQPSHHQSSQHSQRIGHHRCHLERSRRKGDATAPDAASVNGRTSMISYAVFSLKKKNQDLVQRAPDAPGPAAH